MRIKFGLFSVLLSISMAFSSIVYAAEQAEVIVPKNGIAETFSSIGFGAVMLVMLYFVMIRPQNKKMKEHRELLSSIAVGDEVVMSSGIFATVVEINTNFVKLAIANGINIKAQKSAIANVLPKGSL